MHFCYTGHAYLTFHELWNFVSKCQSLEVFKFKLDGYNGEFKKEFNSEILLNSLLHKPLKKVHIVYPHHGHIKDPLACDQYAKICNNVSGSGITNLTMQSIDNFGGFLKQLNEKAKLALRDIDCPSLECNAGMVLECLPNIGSALPNFQSIKTQICQSMGSVRVASPELQNKVLSFFNELQNCELWSRRFEIGRLDVSHADEEVFKQELKELCKAYEIHVSFEETHDDELSVVLEKANVRLVIRDLEVSEEEDHGW